MNFTALLVLMVLMGTMCSSCPEGCTSTKNFTEQYFKHVSPLQDTSVAPWVLVRDDQKGRRPYSILKAVCRNCTKSDMIAKPIHFQISVYQTIRKPNGVEELCRCPFQVAVGCTCVMK